MIPSGETSCACQDQEQAKNVHYHRYCLTQSAKVRLQLKGEKIRGVGLEEKR